MTTKLTLTPEAKAVGRAIGDLIQDRLCEKYSQDHPLSPAEWTEVIGDSQTDLDAVAIMAHGADLPEIRRLDQGGFVTEGATVSKVCRGCKASFCPVHGARKTKITLAKVAGLLDAAEDRGVSGYALVTVTFPDDPHKSFERANRVVSGLHCGGRPPRRLRAAKTLLKCLRKDTVIRGVETIQSRTKATSSWQRWGHVHRLVESDGTDHKRLKGQWAALAGPGCEVHIGTVDETPMRVAGYIVKSERTLAQWKPHLTWMGVGTAALTLHRARAGENVPAEVERARRDLFDWWVETGGAVNPYTRRAKKADIDAQSQTHRAYLDTLYAKRAKRAKKVDHDQDQDTTTPPPTSTDTSTDTDAPIPSGSRRPRRPRRSLDDPLPPGYRRRSTLE
ncbi:hypothetical protein [Gordonia sputi]|uniref:hypothetical protein n=1 Tax=Gordonia sputi TaxID=36823 RepID=UPI002271C32C|nr:hypothetical protein [Gordonia sputi]